MTRVVAASRLHFGLLSLPGDSARKYGGVGLMVDTPGLAVRVETVEAWSARGPLSERALEFAQRFVDAHRAFHIEVEHAPPEHSGLGVGTQLGLAVARALAIETGHGDWPATELAQRIGRGERSAIGIHGFERGGLIVEGGKRDGETIAPLVGCYDVPADWSVVLFTPPGDAAWHGNREREAFAQLRSTPARTDALCRIVLMEMLPALVSADLEAFGEAVFQFNARSGDFFAPVQGGSYASPTVADCVARLRLAGVRGVGQSSWGPTVFAIVLDGDTEQVRRMLPGVPSIAARIARQRR